jgi:hypothetical protein
LRYYKLGAPGLDFETWVLENAMNWNLLGLPLLLATAVSVSAQSKTELAHGPDCSGSWPTNMAFVHLKNAGITDNVKVDFSKTRTVRLASERVGKDLYHQVYDVKFTEKSGSVIEVIAIHDASYEECSMTGVEVFLISKHLGGN